MRTARLLTISRRILSMAPCNRACPLATMHTFLAIMHAPQQPCMPPQQPQMPPQQPCMPPGNYACPPGNHACPLSTMHAPWQPHSPPTTTHTPQQPCMPPATMHAPWQPCMPPVNHACPLATTHPPTTTHVPHNHACPPATMHAPLATTHTPGSCMPPCGQNSWHTLLKIITLPQTSFAGGNKLAPLGRYLPRTRNIPHYAAKLNVGTPVKFTFPSFNMFSLINVTLKFSFQLFYEIQHILYEWRRALNTLLNCLSSLFLP